METLNITYNFLAPLGFALAVRIVAYAGRGLDPFSGLGWAISWLPKHGYAAIGALIFLAQFNARMEPSMHLHALFMGWLAGMVVLCMPSPSHAVLSLLSRVGLRQKRFQTERV